MTDDGLTVDEALDYWAAQECVTLSNTLLQAEKIKKDRDWTYGEELRRETIRTLIGNAKLHFQLIGFGIGKYYH